MPRYEYKVIPAPSKGQKAKGVKAPEARFALTVEELLNRMGADGWEYLRAELLPSDERSGLTGTTVNWRNVLVFRRPKDGAEEAFRPRVMDVPDPTAPTGAPRLVEAPNPNAPLPPEPGAPSAWPADPHEPPLRGEAEDEASGDEAESAEEDAEDTPEDKGRG